MDIITLAKKTKLGRWFAFSFNKDYRRLIWCFRNGPKGIRYLLPGRLWLDKVDICITTKCNLRCDGCNHLIPYYKEPRHLDTETIIASIRKLSEATDWFFHINILGGEPFLNPDLKYILEEVPSEKCDVTQIITNGTVIPHDPMLFDVMRRKKAIVVMSDYPFNAENQEKCIAELEREGVRYIVRHQLKWTNFGEPVNYHHDPKELKRQFLSCMESCHNLLDGKLYYCFRCSHGYNLGLIPRKEDEYVDLLSNTKAQNRKQLRRLTWRRKPVTACQYCLRGTEQNIPIERGKQLGRKDNKS